MQNRKLLVISIGLILILSLIFIGACSQKTAPQTPEPTSPTTPTTPKPEPTSEPIKIGALISYTGPDPLNIQEYRGIMLKLDEVGWEVAGRKIELVAEDDAFDPVQATDKAKKLVQADKVNAIMGPTLVSSILSVSSYLEPHQIPLMCHN